MESPGYVDPSYDSMIAKLISYGRDREEALARAQRGLDEFVIEGIKTTIPILQLILSDPDFQKGRVSTAFLDRFMASRST